MAIHQLLLRTALVFASFAARSALAQCDRLWSPTFGVPGLGNTSSVVEAFANWDPDGEGPLSTQLVATGRFSSIGGVNASLVARYDGTTWFPIGTASGTNQNDYPYDVAVMPNNDLIVGGAISMIGGVSVAQIARWDGNAWHPLGPGLNNAVRQIIPLPNGDLIAAGNFTSTADGQTLLSYIARWDGTTWRQLDSGLGGDAYCAAALPTGDVIVGGAFSHAGGVPGTRALARWNGSSWSSIGTLNGAGFVIGMHVTPGPATSRLAICGSFFGVDGIPANSFAIWDGATWSGTGVNVWGNGIPVVASSVPNTSGGRDFVIGGAMSQADAVVLHSVARWDGSTWSSVGTGVGPGSPSIYAIHTTVDGDVTVGGPFTEAGSVTSNGIARWEIIDPVITQQPTDAVSCRGGSPSFTVAVNGTSPLSFHWRKDGILIDTLSNPSAATPTLTISNAADSDQALYDCLVQSASGICGTATTHAALLRICAADFNCDATVDFFDYLDFVSAFAMSAPTADFNADEIVDFFDYLDFVEAFSGGC